MTNFTRLETDEILTFEIALREEQKLGELLYLGSELREKTQARKFDDTLLLNGTIAESIFSKLIIDNIFLKEASIKQLDITLIDTLLIKSIFTDIIELIAQDKVLLKDEKFTVVEKHFISLLLVGETLVKEIKKLESDTVLLDDNVEQLTLLFKEAVDELFLGSLVQLVKNRIATDALFLKEDRFAEISLIVEDKVLLNELNLFARSLLLGDTLFLIDETVTILISAVAGVLVDALLGSTDFLGIVAEENTDFLLFNLLKSYNPSFLGIILGAQVEDFYFESQF